MADQDGAPRLLDDEWRRKLMFMRTRADLRNEGSAAAAAALMSKLGPKNLLAAAQNPDHSAFGRRVVEGVLKKRGLSPEPWCLAVPGFAGALKHEAALGVIARCAGATATRLRRRAGAAFVAALGFGAWALFGGAAAVWFGLGAAACALFFATWLAAAALRKDPLRMVLLRRFDDCDASDALTRMVARELAPLGHVIALSDLPARRRIVDTRALSLPSAASLFWTLLGALIEAARRLLQRDATGMGAVGDSDGYRRLALRMASRVSLNIQSALTMRETIIVRTNAAWRAFVTDLLVRSADVLIIDVTQAAGDEAWEFEVAQRRMHACVFIATAEEGPRARSKLAQRNVERTVFAFTSDGAVNDRAGFQRALAGAVVSPPVS